jgi:hypothetical protein
MYTNNKEQISLEEAYRSVHFSEDVDIPPTFDDAVDASKVIVHQGDDAQSELQKFLPLIFSAAAREAGYDETQAAQISNSLVSSIDMS